MVQLEGILHRYNVDRRADFDNMLHHFLINRLLYVGAAVGAYSILHVPGYQHVGGVYRSRHRPHDRRCVQRRGE